MTGNDWRNDNSPSKGRAAPPHPGVHGPGEKIPWDNVEKET